MAASENLTLIRMLVVLALFVPVMLFGLYSTDVKKHGIFSESAKEHEIGKGGKLHIASVDELKSEFDPYGAHEPIKEIPEVCPPKAQSVFKENPKTDSDERNFFQRRGKRRSTGLSPPYLT